MGRRKAPAKQAIKVASEPAIFNSEWLSDDRFRDWLKEIPQDSSIVKCKFCKCDVSATEKELITHMGRQKHKKSFEGLNSTLNSTIAVKSPKVKSPAKAPRTSLITSPVVQQEDEADEEDDVQIVEDMETDNGDYPTRRPTPSNLVSFHSPSTILNELTKGRTNPSGQKTLPHVQLLGNFIASELSLITDERLLIDTQHKLLSIVTEARMQQTDLNQSHVHNISHHRLY